MKASNETKQKVISDLIKTAAGRAKLAASMVQPLRFVGTIPRSVVRPSW